MNPEQWINKYEEQKIAINILDVLDKTPHFKKYLTAIYTLDQELKSTSAKYRILRTLPRKAKATLHGMSDEKSSIMLNGRLRRMVDDWIITEWLLQKGKYFIVEKGQEYYDTNGDIVVAKSNTKIPLGTFSGKASFKLWMEQVVIPNLKKGFNGKDRKHMSALKNNLFIQSLEINGYDNTPNHINMSAYSLPINMSPRTVLENAIFNKFKSYFNILTQTQLDGKLGIDKIYNSGGETFNIFELFFLYNMVSFQNQPGEATLKRIFEDLSDIGIIKDFYQFEAEYDLTSEITGDDIPQDYWKYWAAPVGGVFSTSSSLIFTSDQNEFDRVLMRPATSRDFQGDRDPVTRKNKYGRDYVRSYIKLYPPDFIGFSSETTEIISNKLSSTAYNFKDADVVAIRNHGHYIPAIIINGNETIYFDKPIDINSAINTVSGQSGISIGIDQNVLERLLNNKLNPCE